MGIVEEVSTSFCQPSTALQDSSIGEAQAPAKRMVTCEIGGWTLHSAAGSITVRKSAKPR